MKTKIMQITHDLAIGGLQQVVVNICRTIDREKFDISVLCLRKQGEFKEAVEKLGIKVFSLPKKKTGTDYLSFLKVAKILRQEKIEVIHTHNTQPFIDGTIGGLLSGVKTIVHTDHARDFPDKKRYMIAEHLMSYFAYKIIGVSEHTSRNLIYYEKISPKKIVTIENGVDSSLFRTNIDISQKRREIGIKNDGPIIGLGVRLTKQKGIKYLLEAMPTIMTKFSDINLVIAGEGELKEVLQKQSMSLGIDKNVHFLGARLDIPELLQIFDIYVLPSLWEGLPMVLLEAMAAGCPIISTNVGGISKAIESNVNGLLIEPKSPLNIANAVMKVLSDQELQKKFSDYSHKRFNTFYSSQVMTKKYEKLYLRS